MAITLSKLSLVLGVQDAKLISGLNRIEKRVTGFASSVKNAVSTAFGTFGGALALRGLDAAVGAIRNQFDTVDRLAKQSRRLGLPVKDLQALELAAELSGVQTDNLAKSVINLQRRISEAGRGTGTAARNFEDLGLDSASLRGLSATDQVAAIVDALQGVQNQADRTRLAMELLGRSGVEVLTLDANAIRGAADDLERFGGALTTIETQKVEDFNDSVTRLQTQLSLLAQKTAAAVSPLLEQITEGISGSLSATSDAINAIIDDVDRSVRAIVILGEQVAKAVDIDLSLGEGEFTGFSDAVGIAIDLVKEFISLIAEAASVSARLVEGLNRNRLLGGFLEKGDIENLESFQRQVAGFQQRLDRIDGSNIVRRASAEAEAAKRVTEEAERQRKAQEEAAAAVRSQEAAAAALLAKQQEIARLVEESERSEAERDARIRAAAAQRQQEAVEAARTQLETLRGSIEGAQSGLAGAIEIGTVAGDQAAIAAQDPIRSVQEQLAQRALKENEAQTGFLQEILAELRRGAAGAELDLPLPVGDF